VNHGAGGTWHGQCQREEAFRPGKTPFRGVWAGRAPCPWATPWRKALCPGVCPGARPFSRSEPFRTRNHASLGISPGQPPISRRFARANSHFGAFRRGVRHDHGRRPGARHFALANALARGPLPVRSRFGCAITHLFSFPPGNHPFQDVSPGQNPISGRLARACGVPMGDALAQGTLPWRMPWRQALCPIGAVSYDQSRISWHIHSATNQFYTILLVKIPCRGVSPWRAPCPLATPWRMPWREAHCPFGALS
jgi:hypothetical protein